jgi:Type IV secretory pathway, VirB4 components
MFNVGVYRNSRPSGGFFNFTEYQQKPNDLTDLLPWAFLLEPGLIVNKDGSFMTVIAFRSRDLASSTPHQLVAARSQINNAMRRLGSNWCIHIEARRQPAPAYPVSNFPEPISAAIDAERRAAFTASADSAFESHYFLTLTYLPPSDRIGRAEAALLENARRGTTDDAYVAEKIRYKQTVSTILSIFESFMPYARQLDDSGILTYLHDCITERPGHPVHCPPIPFALDGLLRDTPLLGGLEPMLGTQHLRTIGINAYPGQTTVGLLDALNALPFDYRWTCRYLPLDKTDANKAISTMRREWFAKRKGMWALIREAIAGEESRLEDNDASNKAADADAALQVLGGDYAAFGYFTPTITIMDEDLQRLDWKRKEIMRLLDSQGFVSMVETTNAVEAWLSSLPGHAYANVRRPVISTLNLADMMPISAVWGGHEKVRFIEGETLPAVMVTRTDGTTPFHMALHQGDVGHTMVAGPTGGGKSVFLNTTALQWMRYPGARVIIFDKGQSALVSTLLVGGQYYSLGDETGLSLQPLADIEDEGDRIWATDWITGVVESQGTPVTPEMKAEIWSAVESLAQRPRPQRTLTVLRSLIQNRPIKEAIAPFTTEGPHGSLLDANESAFEATAWQCFEMHDLYQRPQAIAPTLAYLFHHLEKQFDGSPTLLVLDEAWLFLDDPIFAQKIREWLKTLRRKKVSVIFASQSLDDIERCKIKSALIENCPTRIFLPNDNAMSPNTRPLYEGFGLSDRQIQLISQATPKREYYYTSTAGNRMFDLALSRFALAVAGTSSETDLITVRDLLATHGPEGFRAAFLNSRGIRIEPDGRITYTTQTAKDRRYA